MHIKIFKVCYKGYSFLLGGRPADMARKIDYLRYYLNLSNASAFFVLVSETKIDKKIDDAEIAIRRYSFCHHDRNKRSGGVAIYSHY